uniref:Uncharacterized protein n=1 Tax=Arundo donax TaxID=35708 RepID=A0A0A9DU79_ARUDO
MGPLFQILSESPSERKKSASMAVAPVMAMFAPFLKSAVVDLDGGRNGSPNLLLRKSTTTRPSQQRQVGVPK